MGKGGFGFVLDWKVGDEGNASHSFSSLSLIEFNASSSPQIVAGIIFIFIFITLFL